MSIFMPVSHKGWQRQMDHQYSPYIANDSYSFIMFVLV